MSRSNTRSPLLIVLALAACGASTPQADYVRAPPPVGSDFGVYVQGFDAEDTASVYGAIEEWNHALDGVMHMHLVTAQEPGGIEITRVDSFSSKLPLDSRHYLAWTSEIGGHEVYVIRDRIEFGIRVYPIVMHELGHVFGAPDRETDGLMHGSFSPADFECLDAHTTQAVASYLRLPEFAVQQRCQ